MIIKGNYSNLKSIINYSLWVANLILIIEVRQISPKRE